MASTAHQPVSERAPGLHFANKAQWDAAERSLVRSGRSPFNEMDTRKRGPRKAPPHQDPAQLVERLGRMVDKLRIVEAIEQIRRADPLALRPQAFNLLINACMRTGKENLAFGVYRTLKERGLTPTPYTFSALIGGLLKTRSLSPRSLARVKAVHREWVELYRTDSSIAAQADGKGNIPTNAFLQLLARAGQNALMYDAFYEMPQAGPQAPNLHTYTILLQALGRDRTPESVSSAISIWNTLCRDGSIPFVDAHALSGLSEAFVGASEQHRLAVLHIARQCFGFLRPVPPEGKTAVEDLRLEMPSRLGKSGGRWTLHYKAISSIFDHLGSLDLSEVATAWLRQMLTERDKASLLDATHVEKLLWQFGRSGNGEAAEDILRLLLEQPDPRHRPTRSAFAYALQACLAKADFARALRIFGMHVSASLQSLALFDIHRAVDETEPLMDLRRADVKCLAVLSALGHSTTSTQNALRIAHVARRVGWLPWNAEAPKREPAAEAFSSDGPPASSSTPLVPLLDAPGRALSMAKEAEIGGDERRAQILRRQAETLAHSDAGVRAHFLATHNEGTGTQDADFVARAESLEQAALREEHRRRFWEPKLARALLQCLSTVCEEAEQSVGQLWSSDRKALLQYFAKGSARGVQARKRSATGEMLALPKPDGLVRSARHQVPQEYALPAARLIGADGPPSALRNDALIVASTASNGALRSVAAIRRADPPISAGQSASSRAVVRVERPPSKREQRARRRLALQGVRTRCRPRPDLVQDRRAGKAAVRKPLRLDDIRPREGESSRRFI